MNESRYENAWASLPEDQLQALRNPKREAEIARELTPRGQTWSIAHRAAAEEVKREDQRRSALTFLTTGDPEGNGVAPPYGKVWDRDYNPNPYPDSAPNEADYLRLYEGTAISYLYGWHGHDRFAWQTAGWNIVRSGAEERKRRK